MEENEEKSCYSSNYYGITVLRKYIDMEADYMDKVEKITDDLRQAIVDSTEYKEYISVLRELEKQPNLKRAVDEFRRENFICQNSLDIQDVIAASEELSARYGELIKQPLVARYLMKEMCVNRMIQRVCMTIVESVDMDTDFLLN